MLLLVSRCAVIIAKFHDILMEKSPLIQRDGVAMLWPLLAGGEPALLLLDLDLPALDVAATLAELRDRAPACKVLVLHQDFSTGAELALLGAGVAGCCSAALTRETVLRIVDVVQDGGVWISQAVMPLLLRQMQARGTLSTPVAVGTASSPNPRLQLLTPRERQIASLVGGGASNKLIARELSITDRTVKAHLGAIFQKLGLPDRLRLALFVTGK
ncbi:response regulator transcription factor [Actimicrobium sp. CCC2.4]|uniref:response regulator transcription factor n=1 Tax=Actimicrobium sp. CCC2.4 TaxID=3048606 RepID=UPI002AC9E567|nr:response regulator transcription factor [Actimicrobium sp. CCC2.4]MEB0136883.1 response regulator transcription factor [Actimicrobium sp. CCC2.4]WPX33433.1 response regulator transcription factor [Actimicrobium sp. CCC2.4]